MLVRTRDARRSRPPGGPPEVLGVRVRVRGSRLDMGHIQRGQPRVPG